MVKAESDADNVANDISFLVKYLDNSRARVSQLEKELSESRHSSLSASAGVEKIAQLEADKVELARQLSVLEDKLRVKTEKQPATLAKKEEDVEVTMRRTSISRSSREPNTVLAETRAKLKEERQSYQALQIKYTELEGRVKEGEAIAAKALRERYETEEALEKIRSECATVDEERKILLRSSAEQDARTGALKAKLSQLKAEFKEEKNEKDELKQTLQEMIELVESLQAEYVYLPQKAEVAEMLEKSAKELKESQNARMELEEQNAALERLVSEKNEQELAEMAEAMVRYKAFMSKLPGPEKPSPFYPSQLEPVCDFGTNLHAYLAQDVTAEFSSHPTNAFQSQVDIVEAALGFRRPKHFKNILGKCFPDGNVKVTATGLQCVGFNTQLYTSLRHKLVNERKNTGKGGAQKRKTGGDDSMGGKGEGRPVKIHKSG
ncbi:hypothetical protein R3P38DRAFT_3521027 [Favolaschia claudopus]|uniref:Uncharacterized protein n=1 Tax=Favolaschia claudopus TaxID=2862362 RepID=A0AAW0BPD3_9AGAR